MTTAVTPERTIDLGDNLTFKTTGRHPSGTLTGDYYLHGLPIGRGTLRIFPDGTYDAQIMGHMG